MENPMQNATGAAVITAFLLSGVLLTLPSSNAADAGSWDQTVAKALDYLRTTQAADGSWTRQKSPGMPGVGVNGILGTGKVSPEDPLAGKALGYIESLVNVKAGHIAGQDARVQLQNYVTSVNVMALTAANRQDRYKRVIGDAAA